MSQYFRIHPENPQPRLVRQGGVIAMPTDSSYALACYLDDKQLLALLVRDLSELANFAMVDNHQYRLIQSVTPGALRVLVLQATKEVPRPALASLAQDHRAARAGSSDHAGGAGDARPAAARRHPLILLPDSDPLNDLEEIRERLEKQVDLIIDDGTCPRELSIIVDLTGAAPVLVRAGRRFARRPFSTCYNIAPWII